MSSTLDTVRYRLSLFVVQTMLILCQVSCRSPQLVRLPAFTIHARMFTDSSDAVLQRRIGANKFFFMSLTWWGIASLSFVYAKSYVGLLVLRCASLTFASLCTVLTRVHTGCSWESAKRGITLAWYITYRSGTRGTFLVSFLHSKPL